MAKAEDAVVAEIVAHKNGAELFSWGVKRTWAEGGEDPCEGIYVHDCGEEVPHWHYVTMGLSDPTKVPDANGTGRSGLGYELSFRLKKASDETEAPEWPTQTLQELGWGILSTKMKLAAGHYLRRRKVITGGNPETTLQGYYVVADPRLSRIACDSGSIEFLQVVGITDEELLQCESGEPDEMEAMLRAQSPLGITDLQRATQDTDEVDVEQLRALQELLARNCIKGLSDDTCSLTIVTSADEDQNFSHEVEGNSEFAVNGRVEATMKRIFALHWAAGSFVSTVRAQLSRNPNDQWNTVLEFEYEED
jgi:hypothetical protein